MKKIEDMKLKERVFIHNNGFTPSSKELEDMFDENNEDNGLYFDSLKLMKLYENRVVLNITVKGF
jgi:hypothetical protein